jgi:hypothetical protein
VSANTNFSAVHITCIPRCAVFLESCISYHVFILVVISCCVFCFLFYILSILCTISFLLFPQHNFCCLQQILPLAFDNAFKVTNFLSSANLLPANTSLSVVFSFTIDRSLFTSSFLQLYISGNFNNRWDSRLATDYGLGGLGIESRWVREFPHASRPTHPTSPTICSW